MRTRSASACAAALCARVEKAVVTPKDRLCADALPLACRPRDAQILLGPGQQQVPRDEPEVRRDLLDVRGHDGTGTAEQWFQGTVDSSAVRIGPQLLHFLIAEEGRGQVRLRVQVHCDNADAYLLKHPGEVVYEGGLSDAALVVEERHHRGRHDLRPTIAATAEKRTNWVYEPGR
jgi:hypothetical protein